MALPSEFVIVAFERRPGRWRAAISKRHRGWAGAPGEKVLSLVTSTDAPSEIDAVASAEKVIRKM
jgi:hypothetical protein